MEYVYSPFREMADEMEALVEALAHDLITPEAALEAASRIKATAEYMADRTYGLKVGDTIAFEMMPPCATWSSLRTRGQPIWNYPTT